MALQSQISGKSVKFAYLNQLGILNCKIYVGANWMEWQGR